jgi:RNA polymerase sigma factor (sigma-70 family)
MNAAESERIFRGWLTAHDRAIERICAVYASDRSDRADLKQQILIQLWQSIASFRQQSSAFTWVYRVAINTALTHQRGEIRRRRRLTTVSEDTLAALPAPASGPDPLESLYAAIQQLDEFDRTLVLLSLDGSRYEDIADICGLSVTNVGARLTRTRQRLAKLIEDIKP